ncbi:AAA family ATPase [Caldinitratiruptor microaerophilus]|uniref:Replication-associated recombination protein A n=1 Tax=Caldinitratiruptor microaerophilus TaxID=671077 RepID=A0AA35CK45_9FIRM|nr:AAA family ATPase [Caldinitratiruptor microaerophilus]BDG60592.1 ATPase AAA [Caldinitratiruptor microaerophilus]
MDLFEWSRRQEAARSAPLADRMRPRTLDEVVGQEHIVGPGRLLRRAIEADRLSSLILWGPPGSGKTTLARIIAATTRAHFEQLNAVTAGVSDIRRIMQEARDRLGQHGQRTVVFVDEIHRWSRSQQDALLPYVEDGTIILIGATTENPSFEVIPPLLSRARLFRLEPLTDEQVRTVVERALTDPERGLGREAVRVDPEALDHIVRMANGDARSALNALELAVLTTPPGPDGVRHVTLAVAEESIQRRVLRYDREGDQHYDVVSAFIKSMRGSDPDAALYWLARMIEAGEDPLFIARRVVIHASEDVGMADPMALVVAVAAMQAVHMVGWPEARLALAQAVVHVATAPKSNAVYVAIGEAMKDVQEKRAGEVPVHLRDASYKGAARLGHGAGYKYPHDFPGAHVAQVYVPPEVLGRVYYRPSDRGFEAEIRRRLEAWRSGGAGPQP